MSPLQTTVMIYEINFPNFKQPHSKAFIVLCRNVLNATELKGRIVSASITEGKTGEREREAVNFAFVNARLVTSISHLETAIHQAILAEESPEGLRTKTVHSEILYYLNPTHNITEAIRRYGVSVDTSDLLLVRVDSPHLSGIDVEEKMRQVVKGDWTSISDLGCVTDWSTIKKYHKLNNEPAITNAKEDVEKEHKMIDSIVTSSVAMKSVTQ